MHIVFATSPDVTEGLLELTFEAIGADFSYFEQVRTLEDAKNMSVMVLDPDLPGRDFLIRYRKLTQVIGNFPLIVLGSESHVTMSLIPWDRNHTHFLSGNDIILRLEVLLERFRLSSNQAEDRFFRAIQAKQDTSKTVELFKGLQGIHLPDILQMLCLGQWTGEVRVHNPVTLEKGSFSICGGQIHAAQTNSQTGEEACYQMIAWKKSEFHFLENVQSSHRTIYAGWEAILMEATCRLDEVSNMEAC